MIKFTLKIVLFLSLLVISTYAILYLGKARGDTHYIKFITPKQKNLILGTSRAAQGVNPAIIEENTGIEFFNFSFTLEHSPYGSVYFNKIVQKVDTTLSNSSFIVTVDPWSLSSKVDSITGKEVFREKFHSLHMTPSVTSRPNLYYLYNFYNGNYYDILANGDGTFYLHDTGWLEVSIPVSDSDIRDRTTRKLNLYRDEYLKQFKFSEDRFEYLIKTLKFLNKFGKVYILRLPVSTGMYSIENEYMPDFDTLIDELNVEIEGYLNLAGLGSDFIFTDGNHLYKNSSIDVSKKIADWINTLN